MQEFFDNPVVQGGVAPFVVALAVAFAFFAVRLGGLALAAALATAAYLLGGVVFPPVSAQQKVLVISLAMPVAGVLVDLAFKPARSAGPLLGLVVGALALWVGINVLKQKELAAMLVTGAGLVALAGWQTAALFALRDQPIRAGAAALALGLGIAVCALLSASGSYALYGASIGAGAGAFLLVQVLLGRSIAAGATFTLVAGAACGLLLTGAVLASPLPWYAAALLALIPAVVRLPLPQGGVWLQAIAACAYAGIAALAACLLAWPEVQQRLGL
ncbi:MAG: hypothetical protein JNM79_14345 [Burkholderiales bacterium]|nr:hypothetical protein [Burkholderiales bacterium]